jgi:hypothetical protein
VVVLIMAVAVAVAVVMMLLLLLLMMMMMADAMTPAALFFACLCAPPHAPRRCHCSHRLVVRTAGSSKAHTPQVNSRASPAPLNFN